MGSHIAVAGAGIAGLAAAAALQRHGHTVSVFEERDDTSPGAGISIWPNALAALDVIGLGDEIRASGGRITGGAMRWRDGTWLRRPSAQRLITALGEPLVVVQRAVLRDILIGTLAPGTVRYGTAVTDLAATAAGVRVRLSSGTDIDVDALVGADGTYSVVARHLNGALLNRYAGYTAWRGIADYAMEPELAGETLGAGAEVGHVPLGTDHTYWFATERTDEGGRATDGELAYLRAKLGSWADPVPAILAATRPQDVLRNDLYDRTVARRWSRGSIVIIGDAAHPMRPHLGQGGCQALEDAAILGELVGAGTELPAALRRFEEVRKPRVSALVRESATIGRLMNLRPALLSALASRSTVLVPEFILTRHLAKVAAGCAFTVPDTSAGP